MFTVSGRNFDDTFAFPPIDDEHIQNAVMVAPSRTNPSEMTVYGWNCVVEDNGAEVWGWEPLFPLGLREGMEFIDLIARIRNNLGI